jgi:hypothetical protein
MLESESKLVNNPVQTTDKMYDKFYIYIPREASKDSSFPFKPDRKLKVKIDVEKCRLVIKKL